MTNDRFHHCMFLLREADRLLVEDGKMIAAAHLSMAIAALARCEITDGARPIDRAA